MRNMWPVILIGALAVTGCDTRASAPDGKTPAQSEATASTPPPAVSHALTAPAGAAPASGAAPVEAPAGAASATAHHAPPPVTAPEVEPVPAAAEATFREITIPAGTALSLQLGTTVSSNGSSVEDPVNATLRRAIVVDGVTVVPAGSAVSGYVTEARRSARVKGRARVGMRFNTVRVGEARYTIRTAAVSRQARATKKADATKIGVGAGAGAVVGAITGGKKGAAIGTAVGAAGGTGVVLATRGEEISVDRGTVISTRLSAPVTIRVRN